MTQNNQLSEREKEVVKHLLQGKSHKLIAMSLGISGRTRTGTEIWNAIRPILIEEFKK